MWGQFSQQKGQLRGHPAAALAPPGGDGGDAAGLCPVVLGRRAGGQEAGHRLRHEGLKMEMRRSLFLTRTARPWSQGPGRSGLCGLGVSCPGWVNP